MKITELIEWKCTTIETIEIIKMNKNFACITNFEQREEVLNYLVPPQLSLQL